MAPYEELERDFSDYIGVADTISTNTGTAALHLAIEGKHYPAGAEIITTEFSMIATAFAIHYAGCTPVFVDCRTDMNIDPSQIEAKISDKTVAILITHVYGRVCEVEHIQKLCRQYRLDLIEDCCESHGSYYHDGDRKGHKVGSLGIGCFSFYRNKIVHAEEGGAITVRDDPDYAANLRDLKNMSFGSEHNYVHERIGFNYRMPDQQALLAGRSLGSVDASLAHRKQIEACYDEHLDDRFIRETRDVVWVYDINCEHPQQLVDLLNGKGIQARRTFAPMSMQPCFGVREDYQQLEAYRLYSNTCYLPVSDAITLDDVRHIAGVVNEHA